MRWNASRALVVGAALCVATSGVGAAAAAAPRSIDSARPDASRAVKPTGSYVVTLGGGTGTRLVVNADAGVSTKEGTFRFTDLGDSGTWLESGTTISLLVTATPTTADFGRLFIGTVTAKGISAGRFTVNGADPLTWSATRGAPVGTDAIPHAAPQARQRRSAVRAAGSYTVTFPGGGPPADLTLKHSPYSDLEGTASITAAGTTGSGVWIQAGKQFAMGLTVGTGFGDVFIGTLTTGGIGEGAKPGAFAALGTGVRQWSGAKSSTCDSTFTVDVLDGKDTNSGTCAAPFQTLTKALSKATSGQTIDVEPGPYDSSHETFPLSVPAGVTIIGDDASRGTSPLTYVAGEIDLDATGSTIEGLMVLNGAVRIGGENTTVQDSTVVNGNSDGLCIDVNTTSVVLNNVDVNRCAYAGVQLESGAAARFVNNSITGNGEGVVVLTGSSANLGTKGHDGFNTLSCNTLGDLLAQSTLLAYGDYWDHVPPTQSTVLANGVDITTGTGVAVNSSFAMLAGSPCA